jgi:hypothetical protein
MPQQQIHPNANPVPIQGQHDESDPRAPLDSRARVPCKFASRPGGCKNSSCPFLHAPGGYDAEQDNAQESGVDEDEDEASTSPTSVEIT